MRFALGLRVFSLSRYRVEVLSRYESRGGALAGNERRSSDARMAADQCGSEFAGDVGMGEKHSLNASTGVSLRDRVALFRHRQAPAH
jgi:hypothetical protein